MAAKEVADTVGVTERTIRRWCRRGEVDAVALGRGWRVWCDADGEPLRP